MKALVAYVRNTLRLTLRDRLVLFFNFLFPLLFFFGFGETSRAGAGTGTAAQLLAMVLILGILGTGFFGGGMRSVIERETNILRRFKVAPITPLPILLSSIITGWLTWVPSILFFFFLAYWRFKLPIPENPISLFVFLSLGLFAFRSIGLIIAAVVNSMAESQVLIQLLYLPMLLFSGATIPLSILPNWMQILAQFLPSTHLYFGIQNILLRNETIWQNLVPAGALIMATLVGVFVSYKLFRWEKEEKLKASAKLWILLVLAPFLALGAWQAYSKTNLQRTRVLTREIRRGYNWLIRDARLVIGDGTVIDHGGLLLRNGIIAEIYTGRTPDPKELGAEVVEGSGLTLMPGLIDFNVDLTNAGGIVDSAARPPDLEKTAARALAAYLYSGITSVRSPIDGQGLLGKLAGSIATGEHLAAQLYPAVPGQPSPPALLWREVNEQLQSRQLALLYRPLFQQVAPPGMLERTRDWISKAGGLPAFPPVAALPNPASGIASGSGPPPLLHGPALHREMQLWVAAGIPPGTVLKTATGTNAMLLSAPRIGFLRKSLDANLLLVEGNPLEDISATERIKYVFLKGERVDRSDLFKDE